MKNRKILLIITCFILSMSLIVAGCSSNKGGTSSNSSNKGETSNTNPVVEKEEPIEIVISGNFDPPKADNNFVQKFLEEKFNVKIKNVKFERAAWEEGFNVLLTSGDIPDIFVGDAGTHSMVQWADQGIIASISQEEIRQYMPNYVADFEAVAPNAWDVGNYNGKNWGVPRIWGDGATGFTPAYNGEWLKAIGFSEPPKTLAEFEDMLTKFTFNDPDGNSKKDTWGMTGRGKDFTPSMFSPVFGAFGIAPYQFKVGDDGKLVWGALTEETRQALKQLNTWYKAGIIDQEFITDTNGEIQKKFVAGRTGVVDTGMWHHLYEDGYFGKISKDQGRNLVVGSPLTGPNGDAYVVANGALQPPLLFGSQLEGDEKKRIKILQMLEFIATTDEGYLTTSWGKEGEHYNLVNGVVVPVEKYLEAEERGILGLGGFYNMFGGKVVSMQKYHLPTEKIAFKQKVTSGVKVLTDPMGPVALQSKAQFEAIVKDIQDQFFLKAISGAKNTDKDFDEFVAQWLKSGGQQIIDEANEVYASWNK